MPEAYFIPLKISVVMPALNEEANIERAIQNALCGFARAGVEGEIIAVNDGSQDGTARLLESLAAKVPNLKILTHATAQGIGKSFWDGVQTASHDLVTLLPGDGENDAYEILRYVPLMANTDIVVPYVFNQASRSGLRRLVSHLYLNLISLVFGLRLHYFNGTVIYRRAVLKDLKLESNGFFYQTELLIKSIRAGYLFAEVPYGLLTRQHGKSSALKLKSITRLAKDALRVFISIHFGDGVPTDLSALSITYSRRQEFLDHVPGPAHAPTPAPSTT